MRIIYEFYFIYGIGARQPVISESYYILLALFRLRGRGRQRSRHVIILVIKNALALDELSDPFAPLLDIHLLSLTQLRLLLRPLRCRHRWSVLHKPALSADSLHLFLPSVKHRQSYIENRFYDLLAASCVLPPFFSLALLVYLPVL